MNGKKYIILELIPTRLSNGEIVQISALKIDGLKLLDRFDYRLKLDMISNPDILRIISYDKDKFKYLSSSNRIMNKFKKWIEDYDLLIIDNLYTENYLSDIENKKESIFKYLNMTYSDDIIDKIIDKYKIEPTNHIVDILYEALIFEKGE